MIGPYLTLPEAASLASLTEDDFAARVLHAKGFENTGLIRTNRD